MKLRCNKCGNYYETKSERLSCIQSHKLPLGKINGDVFEWQEIDELGR